MLLHLSSLVHKQTNMVFLRTRLVHTLRTNTVVVESTEALNASVALFFLPLVVCIVVT